MFAFVGGSYSALSPHVKQLVLAMCKIAHLPLNYLITHSLVAGRWFSPGTLGTKNKTDITEILLKVVLNAIAITL